MPSSRPIFVASIATRLARHPRRPRPALCALPTLIIGAGLLGLPNASHAQDSPPVPAGAARLAAPLKGTRTKLPSVMSAVRALPDFGVRPREVVILVDPDHLFSPSIPPT